MRQKKQMKMLGLLGLLAALPIISACAGNKGSDESRKEKMVQSVSVVQPITGTWINLAYKDVRNKYTNPQHFDNMDPKLWTAKVRELANMGIEYLVFMEVANEGKAYYPSKLMPWLYNCEFRTSNQFIKDRIRFCNYLYWAAPTCDWVATDFNIQNFNRWETITLPFNVYLSEDYPDYHPGSYTSFNMRLEIDPEIARNFAFDNIRICRKGD